jgi:hypothetical protein
MRPEGKTELEALRQMVLAWKQDYLQWAGTTAASDFRHEIEEVVYPYLRRLYDCQFIDDCAFREFMSFCDEQVRELTNP